MRDKFLTRLLYASTAAKSYNSSELGRILESCRKNNPRLAVTGMLFLDNNYFLQCLEGSRENVNALYRQLLQDSRHENVQILEMKEVTERYFGDWSMKYVPSAAVIKRIMQETGLRQFDPYAIDNYTVNAMMESFRNYRDADQNGVPKTKPERSFLSSLFSRNA